MSGDGKENMAAQRKQLCPRESGLGMACVDTEEGWPGGYAGQAPL